MANISKHDPKEERKANNSKNRWINFLIVRDPISIDNFLKGPCEIVRFDISGGLHFVLGELHHLTGGVVRQLIPQLLLFLIWGPEVANVTALSLLHPIQLLVEGLLLSYEPLVDFQSGNLLVWVFSP